MFVYDGLSSWAHVYENLDLMKGLLGVELLGQNRIDTLAREIQGLSDEAVARKRHEVTAEILELVQAGKFDRYEDAEDDGPDEYLNLLYRSPERRSQFVQSFQAYLPQVFQYLALMTHGYTMTDLIEKAKSGDDKAFCDAIQIDRTVLFDIPYFNQRLIRIQLGDERELLRKLSNAIKGRVLGHKFPHRKLWLLFAILDDDGFLNMPLDQLLDICTEVGVHGGITDANTLGKRRNEYKSKKGTLN